MEDIVMSILGTILQIVIWFLVIYTASTYIFSRRRSFGNIASRWHKIFEMQFSTKEFYAAVEDAIKKTEIDNTYIAEVTHSNTTALISSKRLYLQVKRADQMFLICAAPFGKGFFVSWWLGEPLNFIKDLIPRIPKIGPALAQWIYRKTFYQMDTDSMFKDCISGCVYEIVERITKEHGSRGLSELDRQSENIPLKDRFN